MLPKLQIALDLTDVKEACLLADQIKDAADIIEAGTVLVLACGLQCLSRLKEICPNKVILGDIRIIKAGGKLSTLAFDYGADIVTLISDATRETYTAVIKEARKRTKNILIEINESYTAEDLAFWKKQGLTHILFHRSSEVKLVEEVWDISTLHEIRELSKKGFSVYVTGGISVSEIELFRDTGVYAFIIGRSITASSNPKQAAHDYQVEIKRVFG